MKFRKLVEQSNPYDSIITEPLAVIRGEKEPDWDAVYRFGFGTLAFKCYLYGAAATGISLSDFSTNPKEAAYKTAISLGLIAFGFGNAYLSNNFSRDWFNPKDDHSKGL